MRKSGGSRTIPFLSGCKLVIPTGFNHIVRMQSVMENEVVHAISIGRPKQG